MVSYRRFSSLAEKQHQKGYDHWLLPKEINDNEEAKIWDYAGCLYPEGYLGPNQTFLFNGDQIERIFAIGYQDEEQFEFKKKADSVIEQLRKKSAGQQEEQPQ